MKRIKIFLYIIIFILVILSSGLFYLSTRDVGINKIDSLISRTMEEELGCLYNCESIRGNPVSGYTAENVRISLDGKNFLNAEKIDLELDIFSLIRGEPVLSNIEVSGSRIEAGILGAFLSDLSPPQKPSNMIIRKFSLKNSTLNAKDCNVLIKSGYIKTGSRDDFLVIDMNGEFNRLSISASAKISIEGKKFLVDDLKLSSGETTMRAKGTIGEKTDLRGEFMTPDAGIISVIFPKTEGARFAGGLKTSLVITGEGDDITATGVLEPSNFEVSRFIFNGGSGKWKFGDGILYIDEIDSRAFGSPVRGKMFFNLKEKGLPMGIGLQGKDLEIKEWYRPLSWLDFASGEITSMDVELKGPYRNLSGNVSFSSGEKVTMKGHPLENISAEVSVKDGSQASFEGRGRWYGAPVTGEGSISFDSNGKSSMSFSTGDIDISNLAVDYPQVGKLGLQGNLKGNISVQGINGEPSITGDLRTDKLRIGKNILENLEFSFEHRKDVTELESLEAEFRGSTIYASGKAFDLLSPAPGADLEIRSPQVKSLLSLPLKDLSVAGSYAGSSFHIKSLEGSTAGGTLSLKGTLTFADQGDITLEMNGGFENIRARAMTEVLGIPLDVEGKIRGTASVTGTTGKPDISLTLSSDKLETSSLPVRNLKASLKIRDNILFLKGFKALLDDAPLKISGQFDLEKEKESTMDIRATTTGLILEKAFPPLPGMPSVTGEVSADIRMEGPISNPSFSMLSSSPEVQVEGFTLKNVELETINSTEEEGLASYLLTLSAGSTALEFTGDLVATADGTKITFDSRGNDIELADLVGKIEPSAPETLKGKMNYNLKGEITDAGLSGNAKISSGEVQFRSFKLRNVTLPVTLENSILKTDEARAFLYGGKVLLSGIMDLDSGKWQSSASITGADMEMLTSDMIAEGTITGESDLDLKLSGMIGKVYLLNGNGSLKLKEGKFKGFDRLSKITKDGVIEYKSLNAVFNVDGSNIYLMPGSRISAPPKDSSYRYLSASGALGGKKDPMKLDLHGELNVQALGGMMKAMEGIVEDSGNSSIILQNFLSGLVDGYTGADFRRVVLQLGGTWDNPSIRNLEILSPDSIQPIPSAQNGQTDTEDIKFEVKFPTGEGSDSSESAEDQVKKQFMDNILNQIFPEGEDSGNGVKNP